MGGGGTMSAMIASLKSNKSLRRNRERYSRFAKKSIFTDSKFEPLTKEENLLIVEKNKRSLKVKTRIKRLYGLFLIGIYGSLIIYVISVFQS